VDISAVKIHVDQGSSAYGAQTGANSLAVANTTAIKVAIVTPAVDIAVDKKSAKLADLQKMTAAMNQSLEAMNTNIRFKYHAKTKELMVQVVDQTNDKILKEMPSHEFLDTIAAIRECVGVLLDKKM